MDCRTATSPQGVVQVRSRVGCESECEQKKQRKGPRSQKTRPKRRRMVKELGRPRVTRPEAEHGRGRMCGDRSAASVGLRGIGGVRHWGVRGGAALVFGC